MVILSNRRHAALIMALLSLLVGGQATAQVLHRYGQSIQPIFEGFESNPDGSYTMWFGYLNRNYDELPTVPIGVNNKIEAADGVSIAGPVSSDLLLPDPGPADRGQPTYFYPRRQQFVFGVQVPGDFVGKELVWTVTYNGEVNTAIGTLERSSIWSIDEGVWNANRGRGTSGRTEIALSNQAPDIRAVAVEGQVSASVGAPVVLRVLAQDDGMPGPAGERARRISELPPLPNVLPVVGGTIGRNGPKEQQVVHYAAADKTGLAVTWIVYRGTGDVSLETPVLPVDPGGEEVSTTATFSKPGTYVLRAYADDGTYLRSADVTVEVN
jgi:hypothetical protein